ncbi:hypothetical protein SAMN06265375_1013 [Muriicola jejuensis]|uniref:Uncharacterized protein n=1 Tax=Muriicola jejuensis TaxID=504488 RepID=A0A6P0UB75_9FLAO|nr:DUF6090 family protein [Muriicola jejuensis]NER10444.1 hypothetical protein [Muriicola jejuensis]SMP00690.1 hypothetical protein SAMN06265375_1013 [Muriicola jejuensis]
MIKFFRKIRQNLLLEGKTGKYFKYAIGEIFLVVVGILIAINLNNFNEQRQKEKNGIQLLTKLRHEIQQDIIYMDSLKREYGMWYSQSQFILDSVLNAKTVKLERLDQYNIGRGTMNFLHLNRSSYSDILNSGNDIIIKNSELKNKIITFFQETEVELKKLNIDNEKFQDWTYNNIDIRLWHRLWANRNLEHEDWSWLKNPKSDKFRIHETYALFFQNALKANLKAIQELQNYCKIINDSISIELNK